MSIGVIIQMIRQASIAELFQLLLERVWSDESILLLKADQGTLNVYPIKCDVQIREVTEENVVDCLDMEDEKHLLEYKKMLARGDSGQYGYLNGKCVFRRWTMMGGDNVYISWGGCKVMHLDRESVYFHYGYTAPEARGLGIHSRAIAEHMRKYKQYNRYALVLERNASSLVGCYRAGMRVVSKVTIRRRFFIPKVTISDYAGFEFNW